MYYNVHCFMLPLSLSLSNNDMSVCELSISLSLSLMFTSFLLRYVIGPCIVCMRNLAKLLNLFKISLICFLYPN